MGRARNDLALSQYFLITDTTTCHEAVFAFTTFLNDVLDVFCTSTQTCIVGF